MPGILPMKVIKVGSNAQSRIAQACDRCRSKKIRCDGIRPCCSQCSSVGFECKTSDKLSRRAFPRGYTESLEERVRTLESEVRELKDLLDEKDEKIDMLSRLHSQSSQPPYVMSPRRASLSPESVTQSVGSPAPKEETFRVQQSPYLDGEGVTSYFTGTSSSKNFLGCFKQSLQESGKSTADFDTDKLLTGGAHIASRDVLADPIVWKGPPRLDADKLIGIYFQEWAPLFPILHRPTFLELYQKYMTEPETIHDHCSHAQLNLVFGIASLASGSRFSPEVESYEQQWQAAIDTILTDQSMPTLQCLILAQLYCIQRGDHDRLLTYKGLAVSLSSKLGLHQSQKRFALGTSTCEIRKKVFWSLYTVDCFSAVTLGLPKQIKDDDVHCEYPVDADEEYVDETGFKAPCPGEFTRLSSALALFRAARILSRVLEEVYPALPSYELSLQQLGKFSDDLDQWQQSLAPHLRLPFAQDKPSQGLISSRSPLLSLVYHYIRTLINRPAVCASLGDRASSSVLVLASSCKHTVQIVELLAERGLSFSFCLNKDELLVTCGIGLLYQSIGLDADGMLFKDNQKMTTATATILETTKSPCATDFKKLVSCSTSAQTTKKSTKNAITRHNSDGAATMPQFQTDTNKAESKLQAVAKRLGLPFETKESRRATYPDLGYHWESQTAQSVPNVAAAMSPVQVHMPRSEPARSPTTMALPLQPIRPSAPPRDMKSSHAIQQQRRLNLDYLSFSNNPTRAHSPESTNGNTHLPPVKQEPTDWERLIGSFDAPHTNIFDNIYGNVPVEYLGKETNGAHGGHGSISTPIVIGHATTGNANSGPMPDAWNSPEIWTINGSLGPEAMQAMGVHTAHPESVFSLGTDDGTNASGDDLFGPNSDWGSASSAHDGSIGIPSGPGSNAPEAYAGIVMPELGNSDDGMLASMWETAAVM